MRNINIGNCVLPASLLAIVMVAGNTGCSTGSGSGQTGTAGTSGTAGTGSSTAGVSGGTAGTGSSTAGVSGGTAGTGAAGSTGTVVETGVCAGVGTRVLTLDQNKVDDFEEAMILSGWSSFNDVPAAPDSFKIMQEAGGAIMTAHGGHYMGAGALTPVMNGYGVGTVYNMAIDMTHTPPIYCVDVTAFDGVTFWAKAGSTATSTSPKISVNFVIPEQNAVKDGGDCDPTKSTCYDHPQKSITLTTDWQQYSVTFAEAVGQTGAKVSSVIQELLFLSPDATWDFWLDEIQLYKGTPPTTPVMGNSTM
jgi:hypothetical protein